MIEVLKSILYGVVEGITEWLPISSTGHMILLKEFIELDLSEGFWDLFLVVIQLGAILAVVIFFFDKLWPFGKKKIPEDIDLTKANENNEVVNKSDMEIQQEIKKNIWLTWAKVAIACIPLIIGVIFDDILDKYLYNFTTVAITLIVYGIIFIVVELLIGKKEKKINSLKEMPFKVVFIIGLAQLLALIPGTSRSGVTIICAMLLGCSRTVSAEFSFYLSIPVMVGASILKCAKYGMDYGMPAMKEISILLIGMIVAFLVSIFVIKFLMSFIKKHDFKPFGIYRIALGLILIIYIICR